MAQATALILDSTGAAERGCLRSRRVLEDKRTNSAFGNHALMTRYHSEVLGDGWESTKCLMQIVDFIFVSH
jgi:hypothetical protein